MKRILGTLIFSFLYSIGWLSAQCPGFKSPEPTCTRVLQNGDVEIDFDIATMNGASPAQIDSFSLFHSTSGTLPSFTLVNTATIPVVGVWPGPTFTHVGAIANTQNAYYFIVAYCAGTATPLPPSNIIRAVRLSAIVSNDFNISLEWNWDSLTPPLNMTVTVNQKIPPSAPVWNNIGTSAYVQATMFFYDTMVTCLDSVGYKIILINDTAGCPNESSEVSLQIKDNTDPIAPVIDTVSFDEGTNKPLITWIPSPSADVAMYVVLYHPNSDCGNFKVVDTVFGSSNTAIIDATWYDGINAAQYSVYAVDNCGRTSAASDCATSIQLVPTLDVCEKSVRLDWNHYEDFASGPDVYYNIYVRVGGGSNYTFIDSTTENFYNHADPTQNNILTYKVVAVENGVANPKTTSSNRVEVNAEFLKQPKYQYLRYASVEDANYIQLELYTDVASDAANYILKRALDTNDVFATVNVFHAPKFKIPSDSIIFMSDRSPVTDKHHYYYKVDLFDSCNSYMSTSNMAASIRLRVTPDHDARVNKLEWNNIFGWQGGTFSYKIYRFLDGNPVRVPLTKFPDPGRTTVYYDSLLLINDNITAGNPSRGNYCYYIEAIENEPSFKRLIPSRELSNEVCVIQQPYIVVPNAFTPNGDNRNDTFNPIAVYHDITSYEFYVMNRQGEIIYQTKNVEASWDGTVDGTPVPDDVYVYSVKYRASTGQQFEKVGTIAVIR